MARFGNSSASSLISSANAAQTKTQNLNDALATYNYDLSAKDQAAFQAYSQYLTNAAQKTSDPSKQLSYEKALTSAHKSYTSAEIQRASIAVDYGQIDNTQKYGVISQLRDAAIQNGDEATAQNLELKMAGLSQTIQNQAIAAQNSSDRAGRQQQKAWKDAYSEATSKTNLDLKKLQGGLSKGEVTPDQFAEIKSQIIGRQVNIYKQAAENPSFDNASDYKDKLIALAQDKDTLKYLGDIKFDDQGNVATKEDGTIDIKPSSYYKAGGFLSTGENPQALTIDEYGIASTVDRKKDGFGNYKTGQLADPTDQNPGTFEYQKKFDPSDTAKKMYLDRTLYKDKETGLNYFMDPVLGKVFEDPKDGHYGRNADLLKGKFDYGSTNAYGQQYGGALKSATTAIGNKAGAIIGGSAGNLAGNSFGPLGGFVGGAIGSFLGNAKHQQELQASKDALAKVQAAQAVAAQSSYKTAIAAQPVSTLSPKATGYNPISNTVTGVAGPVKPTPAIIATQAKAASTVGTPTFNAGIAGFDKIKI